MTTHKPLTMDDCLPHSSNRSLLPLPINKWYFDDEKVRSAYEGLHTYQGYNTLMFACSICNNYVARLEDDKGKAHCLECWINKWFPVFVEEKEEEK